MTESHPSKSWAVRASRTVCGLDSGAIGEITGDMYFEVRADNFNKAFEKAKKVAEAFEIEIYSIEEAEEED